MTYIKTAEEELADELEDRGYPQLAEHLRKGKDVHAMPNAPSPETQKHADDCQWHKTRLTIQRRCTCGALDAEQPAPQDHEEGQP